MAVTPRQPDLVAMLAALDARVQRLERPSSVALDSTATIGGVSGTTIATVPPGAWQAITLGTNVTSLGSPYMDVGCRLENSTVRLKGVLNFTGTIAANATLATLPVGFRPPRKLVNSLVVYNNPGYGVGRMFIDTAGVITIDGGFVSGANAALDGMTFPLTN